MKYRKEKDYELSPEAVDEISMDLEECLSGTRVDKKDRLRLRLSLEEMLLGFMPADLGNPLRLFVTKRFGKYEVLVSLPGERRAKRDEEYGESGMTGSILSNLGLTWESRYEDGVNLLSVRIACRKANMMVSVLAAALLAVVSGLLFRVLPAGYTMVCSDFLIDPLFETFMGFLNAIVGPMMFLSVLWGVYSIGDPKQLGAVGKKMFSRFLFSMVLVCAAGGGLVICFFPFELSGAGGGGSQMKELADMIYDIVPDNLFTPFLTGNTLQIIFWAVLIGIVMIVLKRQVSAAVKLVEQCNAIVQQILSTIGRLVPLFVFLSIIRMILSEKGGSLLGFVKMIIVYLAAWAVLLTGSILYLGKRYGIPFLILLKKLLPAFLIALTTGSSAAAFGECTESCIKKLGVEEKLVHFGLPLGVVVYMPYFALWLVMLSGACMEYAGVAMTPVSLAITIFISIFLAIAAPPIPGGALTCYTILLTQLKLPLELLAIASATNVIMDFTATAGNMAANAIQLVHGGFRMHMIDETVLRSSQNRLKTDLKQKKAGKIRRN